MELNATEMATADDIAEHKAEITRLEGLVKARRMDIVRLQSACSHRVVKHYTDDLTSLVEIPEHDVCQACGKWIYTQKFHVVTVGDSIIDENGYHDLMDPNCTHPSAHHLQAKL